MIRQFQSQDAGLCCELMHACLDQDDSFSPALRETIRGKETPESMIERTRLYYLAVFESENRILGLVGLDMNEIRLLCVSPDHQKCGIGRALLKHIIDMVPCTLFADIFVYSSVRAEGFYQSCGFITKEPVSFQLGGESMPTLFMIYPIIM
jgi:N-acetylglutamate synthase-like GNAT family acetyltransferase